MSLSIQNERRRHVGRSRGGVLRDARAAEGLEGESRAVLLRHRLPEPDALARVGLLRRAARLRRDAEHGVQGHGVQLSWVVPTSLLIEIGGEIAARRRVPGRERRGERRHRLGDVVRARRRRRRRDEQLARGRLVSQGRCERTSLGIPGRQRCVHGHERSHDRGLRLEVGEERQPARSLLHRSGRVPAPQGRRRRSPSTTLSTGDELGIYSGTQSGYYVQGVYQFCPRWRAGVRYDRLDASNAFRT